MPSEATKPITLYIWGLALDRAKQRREGKYQEACTSTLPVTHIYRLIGWAYTLVSVYFMGVYLTGVHLMGVYLMSVHLTGVCLMGVPHGRASHGRVS